MLSRLIINSHSLVLCVFPVHSIDVSFICKKNFLKSLEIVKFYENRMKKRSNVLSSFFIETFSNFVGKNLKSVAFKDEIFLKNRILKSNNGKKISQNFS